MNTGEQGFNNNASLCEQGYLSLEMIIYLHANVLNCPYSV